MVHDLNYCFFHFAEIARWWPIVVMFPCLGSFYFVGFSLRNFRLLRVIWAAIKKQGEESKIECDTKKREFFFFFSKLNFLTNLIRSGNLHTLVIGAQQRCRMINIYFCIFLFQFSTLRCDTTRWTYTKEYTKNTTQQSDS